MVELDGWGAAVAYEWGFGVDRARGYRQRCGFSHRRWKVFSNSFYLAIFQTKARKELGYSNVVSVDEGMKDLEERHQQGLI